MAVGFPTKDTFVNGDVYSAGDVNDLAGTVNLLQSAQYAAGKNKIINGDMGIWQRGTSFSSPVTNTFTADRWRTVVVSGSVSSATQQALTPGDIPNFDGQYFQRMSISSGGDIGLRTRLEDVRLLAGQTVTLSFYVKCSTAVNASLEFMALTQNFGSGGSTGVFNGTSSTNNTTWGTSWVRCSGTISLASVSGKTIGANSYIDLRIDFNSSFTGDVDITGVQLEAGSTVSPFQTATGTKQGELAACQRYYWRASVPSTSQSILAMGRAYNTTLMENTVSLPVSMRIYPTTLDYANISMTASGTTHTSGTWTLRNYGDTNQVYIEYVHGSGVFTAGQIWFLATQATLAGYIGLSAEL